MDLGALLVFVGVLLAVIDLFVDAGYRNGRVHGTLLHVAVILIGVGVLIGVGDGVVTHK